MEKLLRFTEVCKTLGITRHTMRRWIANGKGPKVIMSPGGQFFFREADLRRWEDALDEINPSNK